MRPPNLSRARRTAESLMLDACTVSRPGEADPVYEGKAKRQTYEPSEARPEAGGHTFTVQRYSAHFPVGSFEPEVGDVITWTASVFDPGMVGRTDRVVALLHKSFATALRVMVEEVVA